MGPKIGLLWEIASDKLTLMGQTTKTRFWVHWMQTYASHHELDWTK